MNAGLRPHEKSWLAFALMRQHLSPAWRIAKRRVFLSPFQMGRRPGGSPVSNAGFGTASAAAALACGGSRIALRFHRIVLDISATQLCRGNSVLATQRKRCA